MKHNRHPAELLTEKTYDQRRYEELHGWREFTGSLVLADFLATKGDTRARIWQAASADDRRGLVMQALRERGVAFDNDIVEAFIAKYDEQYTGGTRLAPEPPVSLIADELRVMAETQRTALIEALREAVACPVPVVRDELLAAAGMHRRELNASNRAAAHLGRGVRLLIDLGSRDYLVPSSENNGTVYRVRDGLCSCKAGVNNRVCWHAYLVAATMSAYTRHGMMLDVLDRISAARRRAQLAA